uniref:(northern house mosquito) hypothetical protein n=1 Tax=Culex pipiens TaxID=7175 RepID=A0A8D8AQ12_CULPI
MDRQLQRSRWTARWHGHWTDANRLRQPQQSNQLHPSGREHKSHDHRGLEKGQRRTRAAYGDQQCRGSTQDSGLQLPDLRCAVPVLQAPDVPGPVGSRRNSRSMQVRVLPAVLPVPGDTFHVPGLGIESARKKAILTQTTTQGLRCPNVA